MKTILFLFGFLVFMTTGTAQQTSPMKTENVILITLDGLRWQELFSGAVDSLLYDKAFTHDTARLSSLFWNPSPEIRRKKLMPFFWETIAAQGQIYGNRWKGNQVNCTNQMWFSYPGYNEILTGYPDDQHINSNDKIPNPNVTVLEALNSKADFHDQVAAFGSWDVFPYIINEERSGVPVNAGFDSAEGWDLTCREEMLNTLQKDITGPWQGVRLDGFTHHYAVEYLKKYQPRLLYIAYGETDDFAHDGRYDFYLQAANNTDRLIGELWTMIQSHPAYRNKTTLIITTDHGRGHTPKDTWKHHGIRIPDADEIWYAVLGPDTPPTGEQIGGKPMYQYQIAPTVARFLGQTFADDRAVETMFR